MSPSAQPRRKELRESARLILVDDHDAARASLRDLLRRAPGLEVVGEASNGHEALELFQRLKPDLMLVDVQMPGLDGLAVTRAVKVESPSTRVVMVTVSATPDQLLAALKAGADAYVLKGTSRRAVVQVLRGALQGRQMLQPELAAYLLEMAQAGARTWATIFSEPLSATEMEVLRLTMQGCSRTAIGRALDLAQAAVAATTQRILAKLGVIRE
jgi:DNA-binding NarL/FixJ family response regulator